MTTHLEPDILECEVKWALGLITMNKASRGDGIPVELFQTLKDDAALNMPANLENSAVATGVEEISFHSSPKEMQKSKMAVWRGLQIAVKSREGKAKEKRKHTSI